MLPNSLLYIGFVGLTVAIFWLLPQRFRVTGLILFAVPYYLYASPLYLILFLLLALWTFATGEILLRRRKKSVLIWSVGLLVLVLGFFKYAAGIGSLFPDFSSSSFLLSIPLPLGISFFVFEFIHYIADIYRGVITKTSLRSFLSFSFFFPSLVSGPIKRYEHFSEQLSKLSFHANTFFTGILLLILGYAQKIIVADPLIPITSALKNPETLTSSANAIAGLYAYSIRIYADFAGLSNIAIGTALLFGIVLPKNFDYPYLSTNISVFWRRWHMSLSSWIRDYLYIPLGGNRVGEFRTSLNLLIVMTICGMWHGPSLNFPLWGLYHGIGMALHRVWRERIGKRIPDTLPYRLLGILITFHFVTFGWAFFLTSSLDDSLLLLKALFSLPFHA